ncbi:hypothetical protein C2845_PM17G13570 [Panicum miliaceum]|uniref:Uncharacterized protein n=1 Tax=Panicum miliaceum TaxID=4540 RepID=A0A3L6Q1T0_PANMI|nr:hypothetical protein C2845_PM17G13570 [Panicum miliaceum]
MRKHVGAKKGYYGSFIVAQLVMAKSGAMADGDVKDARDRDMIKHVKDSIMAESWLHQGGFRERDASEGDVLQERHAAVPECNGFSVQWEGWDQKLRVKGPPVAYKSLDICNDRGTSSLEKTIEKVSTNEP